MLLARPSKISPRLARISIYVKSVKSVKSMKYLNSFVSHLSSLTNLEEIEETRIKNSNCYESKSNTESSMKW